MRKLIIAALVTLVAVSSQAHARSKPAQVLYNAFVKDWVCLANPDKRECIEFGSREDAILYDLKAKWGSTETLVNNAVNNAPESETLLTEDKGTLFHVLASASILAAPIDSIEDFLGNRLGYGRDGTVARIQYPIQKYAPICSVERRGWTPREAAKCMYTKINFFWANNKW